MYILVVGRGVPSLNAPMNGIFEWDQAKALAQAGHKVVYAAIDLRSIRRFRKLGVQVYKKNDVWIYNINVPIGAVPVKAFDYIGKKVFKKAFKSIELKFGKPDIIHAHFLECACIVDNICKENNIKFVITEHTSNLNNKYVDEISLKRMKHIYGLADQLIAVSNPFADMIYGHTGILPKCVYDIVESDIFNYNNGFIKTEGKFTFVSTGRLTNRKGFDLVLKAFFKLKSENSINTRLIIIGSGPEFEALNQLVKENNMEDYVEFRGMLTRKEIFEIYKRADAFVLASRNETFGVVYIEAMCAGLPVIATRCGGPEDFVNDDTGIVINSDDEMALYEAMIQIIREKDVYISENISNYAKEMFSASHIANQLTEIYLNLMK